MGMDELMTKRTRTILFIISLILFFLVAPAVVFYSQGYRIDFQTKKITQTGGLFLKVWPKQVKIYLNGKLKKKTDFFFGSTLIENLLPKKYRVRVEKEGYFGWEKEVEIKEKGVEEFKDIFLIPKNPSFKILGKGVNDFYFSPDGKRVILKEIEENRWALKLYDLERNVKSHLISEGEISKTGAELLNLEFSPDSKMVLLKIGIKEKIKYYNLEIEKIPPVLTEIEQPLPTLDTIPLPNIVTYQIFNKEIYYLDKFGHLFKNRERLTEKPFPIKPETKYELSIFKDRIFLQEDKILYLFNPSLKSFEKFFEGINSLKISPDFKKIVYFSDFEIWILFLQEKSDQPQKKAGEQLFLTRFSEKINQLFWYTSHYLIFNLGNKIKITEIDDRDRINIVDLAEFKDPKIFFNKEDKRLYVLSEGNFYSSEILLP
jgi:WD40 repeat protein